MSSTSILLDIAILSCLNQMDTLGSHLAGNLVLGKTKKADTTLFVMMCMLLLRLSNSI